jgi:hypothetical protein
MAEYRGSENQANAYLLGFECLAPGYLVPVANPPEIGLQDRLRSMRVGAIARQWAASDAKYVYDATLNCWEKKATSLLKNSQLVEIFREGQ